MKQKKLIGKIALYAIGFFCVSIMNAQITNTIRDTGNVGVGTLVPECKLHVSGSSRIDSTLVIGDSLKVIGDSKLKDVNIDGNAIISGNAKISGTLELNNTITLGGATKISYFPPVGGGPSYLFTGSPIGLATDPTLIDVAECIEPLTGLQTPSFFAHNGMFTSWGHTDHNTSMGVNRLDMGFDGANGIIDIMGHNAPKLLMNYYCGSDILMCTGSNGGTVSVGRNLEVGLPFRDLNIALHIKANDKNGLIIKSFGTNAAAENAFEIWDGNTGSKNFVVQRSGHVFAREIKVSLGSFPDYVFNEDYKLMPINMLAGYVSANRHLPGVASEKEIVSNGINLGEMQKVQMEKIEEAYLYIIELNNKMDEASKENMDLKDENASLKEENKKIRLEIEKIKAYLKID